MAKSKFEMIPSVQALHFPSEVVNWCNDHEIYTHYQHTIEHVEDDGTPLSEWLKSEGLEIPKNGIWIAIFAT